jgi:hypothetical protein
LRPAAEGEAAAVEDEVVDAAGDAVMAVVDVVVEAQVAMVVTLRDHSAMELTFRT